MPPAPSASAFAAKSAWYAEAVAAAAVEQESRMSVDFTSTVMSPFLVALTPLSLAHRAEILGVAFEPLENAVHVEDVRAFTKDCVRGKASRSVAL